MKVKKRTLLLIACFVWAIAGFNVLRIGIMAYPAYLSVLNIFCLLLYLLYSIRDLELLLCWRVYHLEEIISGPPNCVHWYICRK